VVDMTTFVVPVDGSRFAERAVPVALDLAARTHGEVVVMTTDSFEDPQLPHRYLAELEARFDGGFRTECVHASVPGTAIEDVLGAVEAGTVCMTTHGRGGLRWAMLGSVAEDVVRGARRPVVLVGRHGEPVPRAARKLLVCFDESSMARAFVPVACDWARWLGFSIELVYVAHPLDVDTPKHPDLFDEAMRKIEAEGLAVEGTVLPATYVAGSIADRASDADVGLVAIATHARTGVARVGLGSVAMGVVAAVPRPVLVHRPT
jgi:nucleotide-binding universal stress UspA family protein